MPRKAPWGQARIEVIALADEIRRDIKDGLPVSQIFQRLRETGRYTNGQSAFYKWVKELRGPTQAPKPTSITRPAAALPSTTPSTTRTLRFSETPPVEEDLWNGTGASEDLPIPTEKEPSDGAD